MNGTQRFTTKQRNASDVEYLPGFGIHSCFAPELKPADDEAGRKATKN